MLNWEPTPENIRQQIAQIDFILSHPEDENAQLFMQYWKASELLAKRNLYAQMLERATLAA